MKSEGNRAMFLRTCSLIRLVETPYRAARSRSSITFWSRMRRMHPSTFRTSAVWVILASVVIPSTLLALSQPPVNEGWSAAARLPEPIQELSAAVLRGKIYVAGGIDRTGRPTAAAFRYDPAANRWERIADLPAPRHHMPLVVVGGWGAGRQLVRATAIYDPASDRWHDAAPIPTPRDHLTAAVARGLVYAIGGRPLNPDRNYDVLEAYDPATDRWTRRSAMPSRRGGLAAAVLDSAIHVIGGETR